MGLFSGIGKAFNDIMGVTASQNAQINANYRIQKEFAQNAHQWEAQDLAKAGYNPALTTGLGGASAGGAGGIGGGVSNGANPIGMIAELINAKNATKATDAGAGLQQAQTELTNLQVWKQAFENGLLEKYGEKEKVIALNVAQKTGTLIDAQTAKQIADGKLSLQKVIESQAITNYTKSKGKGKGFNLNTPFGGFGTNW